MRKLLISRSSTAVFARLMTTFQSALGERSRPYTHQQHLIAYGILYALTRAGPGEPFTDIHFLGIPPWYLPFPLSIMLLYLSTMSVDIIVGLPLVIAYAGIFNLTQTATAIFATLAAHAIYSLSLKQWITPKGVEDLDVWAKKHSFSSWLRQISIIMPIVGALWLIPPLKRLCDQLAAKYAADATVLFVGACVIVGAVFAGCAIYVRRRWKLGNRRYDDLFREIFWVLLTVCVALIPAAFKASWAPTLICGLAIPLLIARVRVFVNEARESNVPNQKSTGQGVHTGMRDE